MKISKIWSLVIQSHLWVILYIYGYYIWIEVFYLFMQLFYFVQNFSPNSYFEDSKLTKTFAFLEEGTTKITATPIKWKEGMVKKNDRYILQWIVVLHEPDFILFYWRVLPMELHMRKMEISGLTKRTGSSFTFPFC